MWAPSEVTLVPWLQLNVMDVSSPSDFFAKLGEAMIMEDRLSSDSIVETT